MTEYEINYIDSEDVEEFLVKVETSFDIKFVKDELANINTFGELCDHITGKIDLINSADCTSQQAFYKIRDAISTTLTREKKTISTDLFLSELLPKATRRSTVKSLEKHLGFRLNLLRPPQWITLILSVAILSSLIGLFFNWKLGLFGLVISSSGLWFANKLGNELKVRTVGHLAEKMVRENYLKSRRNQNTFNKKEIERILFDWFCSEYRMGKTELTRETRFN